MGRFMQAHNNCAALRQRLPRGGFSRRLGPFGPLHKGITASSSADPSTEAVPGSNSDRMRRFSVGNPSRARLLDDDHDR